MDRSGESTAELSWNAVSGADVYSVMRGVLTVIGPGQYGACLAEGLQGNTHQDPDPVASGTGFFYLVQAQSAECGLGSLGFASSEQHRSNTDPGACQGISVIDAYPQGETSVAGSVSGSYVATTASDDDVETITEVLSGGNPNNRYSYLEHHWLIEVHAGSRVELHVEGYRTSSADGDAFSFEYSSDGATWNPISIPDLPLADDDIDLAATLPGTLSGSVTFRVMDTNRDPGSQFLDSISIDELFVRSFP
jgi:hypothetical protein